MSHTWLHSDMSIIIKSILESAWATSHIRPLNIVTNFVIIISTTKYEPQSRLLNRKIVRIIPWIFMRHEHRHDQLIIISFRECARSTFSEMIQDSRMLLKVHDSREMCQVPAIKGGKFFFFSVWDFFLVRENMKSWEPFSSMNRVYVKSMPSTTFDSSWLSGEKFQIVMEFARIIRFMKISHFADARESLYYWKIEKFFHHKKKISIVFPPAGRWHDKMLVLCRKFVVNFHLFRLSLDVNNAYRCEKYIQNKASIKDYILSLKSY